MLTQFLPFFYLILEIEIIGAIVFIITKYIEMHPAFRAVIYLIAAIAVVLILINFVGSGAVAIRVSIFFYPRHAGIRRDTNPLLIL